jgi:D-alanine-D-alanine ligase
MSTPQTEPRLRVVVLAGGDSAEREVSLRSGAAVADALKAAGHQIRVVDPGECSLGNVDWSAVDACFIALHGGAGEDGRIQQHLQRLGVPYTGSGPEACRLAMSKSAAKDRFVARGVPTPAFVKIEPGEAPADVAARVEQLGYPLIIKPDGEGSSIGLSLVERPADLAGALAAARGHHSEIACIAESFFRGREFTVAVLDEQALPIIEIVSPERVFSYNAKYASAQTQYLFDFELADDVRRQIADAAVAAAKALGTAGLARVDVMLNDQGRVGVLEVNTIPGLTARSLAPQAALRAGMDMTALCDSLVRRCLAASEVS